MTRRVFICLLLCVCWASAPAAAQPFDLIIPDQTINDSLSRELRDMQTIERDIQMEKLKSPASKLEAYIELGNLRLEQGKLEEARRFFEMAIELQPENMLANKGLAMVHYHSGEFNETKAIFDRLSELYPLSDVLKSEAEKVRRHLRTSLDLGYMIREDSRGVQEIHGIGELFFPSFTWPKLSARYRLEDYNYKDGNDRENSRLLSGTFNYVLDHRNQIALTYAPEIFSARKDVHGYDFQAVTGSGNLHASFNGGRHAFKENLATMREALGEDYATITFFGELNPRTRVSQTFTAADISDGNSRRRFDTDVLYFITRRGVPLFSLRARASQASYEKQSDPFGNALSYWTPADFRGTELALGWERGVGSRWWWGCEAQANDNTWRDTSSTLTQQDTGLGFILHASYRYERGRIHARFTNTLHDFYRERSLGIFGSLDF
ncbi:MAG TPA: tetratricopeptide repeat protein [Candidatus Ozemobacteraceae bacterium]|nr:tetratricopeptide repeat protein [Candidatus Ozemobacteraceae bacterium]